MTPAQRLKIAKELNVNVGDVEQMEGRMSAGDQSLNAHVGEDGEEEWIGFLQDEGPNPEEVVTGLRDAESRSRWLAEAIGELTEREQTIIHRRRMVEDGATLEELGKVLGVSKERVRQLESRALQKLKVSIGRQVDLPSDLLMDAAEPL